MLAVAALLVTALMLPLFASPAEARPGDISITVRVSPSSLEAMPTDAASMVTFSGNLSFTQPFYQRGTVDLTATTTRNWTAEVQPARVVRTGSGVDTFALVVTVPPSALAGEVATVTVTARASTRFGTAAEATATAALRVRPWNGYWANASNPIEVSVPQGAEGSIGFRVRNAGNVEDRFAISAPYWYGLQRYGIIVQTPQPVPARAHADAGVLVTFDVRPDTVPRVYEVRIVVDSLSLQEGTGTGATQDPKWVRAWINVTGSPPADDPYSKWRVEAGPQSPPAWQPLFGTPDRRAQPDVDPKGALVVFSRSEGAGRASIQMGAPDGSSSMPLTRGDALDECPVISPDGSRIAFLRDGREVVLMSTNGTELDSMPTELLRVTITDWSPAGERLLLCADGDLHELDLAYNTTRLLAGEPVDQWGATYSSDGSRIYYLSYEAAGPAGEVWSMAADGSDHRQLTFNDLQETQVTVSPNGQRVAFSLEDRSSGGDRLCVMSAEGAGVRWFTEALSRIGPLRWMPDGKALVAEVRPLGGAGSDLARVDYPWKDASTGGGSGGGGGGGGGGGAGGGSHATGAWGWLLSPTLWAVVALVALCVAGGAYGLRSRARSRAESADRLKEITGKGRDIGTGPGAEGIAEAELETGVLVVEPVRRAAAGPPRGSPTEQPFQSDPEGPLRTPAVPRGEYATSYTSYDGSAPPPEPAPVLPRVRRRGG
jgi:hypothetical protein